MEQITKSLEKNRRILDDKIGVGRNFDVISRDLMIGGRSARLYVLDGYGDDGVIERIVSFLLQVQPEDMESTTDMDQVIRRFVTFGEVNAENRLREILTGVFLGKMALIIERFDYCALIDAKTFPSRGVQEPSDGRVLRGAHDGFVEVLLQNTSLIRRRIRDENLTLENHKVGANSRSDIVLAYMYSRVEQKH